MLKEIVMKTKRRTSVLFSAVAGIGVLLAMSANPALADRGRHHGQRYGEHHYRHGHHHHHHRGHHGYRHRKHHVSANYGRRSYNRAGYGYPVSAYPTITYRQPYATSRSYGSAHYSNSPNFGNAVGGALGGYLGSKVGKGSGQLAATAAGAVIGYSIGGHVGSRY